MRQSPLRTLSLFGQSPWLDYIERRLLASGGLERMIDDWGIRGVTTNPSIFQKAVLESTDYDEQIAALAGDGRSASEIYDAIVLEDVDQAAAILGPVYESSDGEDGYVSIEVSPHLARDTGGTCAEARRFWETLGRANVMIKVPATRQGLPAIRHLIAAGINVNVTLLFSLERYREVVDAYLSGLEDAEAAGHGLHATASVASFFLSRIDTMVDRMLETFVAEEGPQAAAANRLVGEAAIASARRAYAIHREMFASERFRRLADRGAQAQRLLWASTGTKNPAYSDIKYVEPLIGPGTVSTMPLETLRAYDDHGQPDERLTRHLDAGAQSLAELERIGIDLGSVTRRLLDEGAAKFERAYDELHATLGSAAAKFAGGRRRAHE